MPITLVLNMVSASLSLLQKAYCEHRCGGMRPRYSHVADVVGSVHESGIVDKDINFLKVGGELVEDI